MGAMEKNDALYTVILETYGSKRISFRVPLRYAKLRIISIDYGVIGVTAVDTLSLKKVTIHRYILQDVYWLKNTWKLLQLRTNLDHPNIVKLLFCYTDEESFTDFESFYLITESMDSCLQYVMVTVRLAQSHRLLSRILHQVLTALSYLHSCGIVLRTMNTGNTLMNFTQNVDTNVDLKLIGNPLISQVEGYISPECLSKKFRLDPKTDSWLVGCMFGELLQRKSLFPMHCDPQDLFTEMLYFCDKPSDTFVKTMTEPFREIFEQFEDADFGAEKNFSEKCFPCPDEDLPDVWNEKVGMDLLSKFLVIDPEHRLSVEEALNHPYVSMWNKHDSDQQKSNFQFKAKEIDSLCLSFHAWKRMFYNEILDMGIKQPLLVNSLQDMCIHSISRHLDSMKAASELCLPSCLKTAVTDYMDSTF